MVIRLLRAGISCVILSAVLALQDQLREGTQLQPAESPHGSAHIVLAAATSLTTSAALSADALAESELSTSTSIGDTVLPVVSTHGFVVGGVVRLHAGYPNQEDHRVRSLSHNAVYLASAGTEFPHNRYEIATMLAAEPLCPGNCSSHGACEDGACQCADGYAGVDCSNPTHSCQDNCNGNGICVQGLCRCHAGYTGGYCQYVAQLCVANCSGHGICSHDLTGDPLCSCEPGFTGADCSMATSACPGNCTGHGVCVGHECQCDVGFGGSDCTLVTGGCLGNCTGHGECLRNGTCLCEPGFTGPSCNLVSAFAGCPANCSAHGACVMGECRCDAGFEGLACDLVAAACPMNCSGHGFCSAQVSSAGLISYGCECEIGFAGFDCSIVRGGCPGNCTGHGTCFNGTCFCDDGFTAGDCSLVVQTCAKNCSGHGLCLDSVCECHVGFGGEACDVVLGSVCPRNCTGHGACDESTASCMCDPGYGGDDCGQTTSLCASDCSQRGNCVHGACVCLGGYAGSDCSVTCPSRCHSPNGVCLGNGKCHCNAGWSGADCDTPDMVHHLTTALSSTGSSGGGSSGGGGGGGGGGVMYAMGLQDDFTVVLDGTLWIFYPVAMVASCAVAVLSLFCCCAYCMNLRAGLRGTQAVPLYRYMSESMSYSDYQLKPGM
jgi:hypothetical protein